MSPRTSVNTTLARVRGLIGLTTLGEGLFILFRVVPHESPLLGACLALLGAALLWRAKLPLIDRLPVPRLVIALGGAAAAGGVILYDAMLGAALDAPKLAIILLGIATALAAPFADRPLRLPWRPAEDLRVASVLLWSVPLAWAPLAVWALQGAAKTGMAGTTPLEVFVRYGLLAPMAAVLSILGRHPSVVGQVITYQTPHGPFALQVGVACSGLQAMALFAGILGVYLVATRPPPKEGIRWSIIGMVGVYLVNVLRLVVLSLVGSAWGADALEQAHAQAGWIFFVAWTGVFAYFAIAHGGGSGKSARAA